MPHVAGLAFLSHGEVPGRIGQRKHDGGRVVVIGHLDRLAVHRVVLPLQADGETRLVAHEADPDEIGRLLALPHHHERDLRLLRLQPFRRVRVHGNHVDLGAREGLHPGVRTVCARSGRTSDWT